MVFDKVLAELARVAPRFAAAAAILLGFVLVSVVLRLALTRVRSLAPAGKRVAFSLLEQLLHAGILGLGLITALGTAGVNVSALVASLGLTGFALGFALKDALSNLLAGLLVLLYRPFRVSDRISVTGLEGVVKSIDLRYTVLEDDAKTYLIPNATLFTNAVIIVRPASHAA